MKQLWHHIYNITICALAFSAAPAWANANIKIEGIERDSDLYVYIQDTVIEKYEKKDEPTPSQSKIKADLEKALKAQGYYAAKVTNKTPEQPIFQITPNEIYTLNLIDVRGYDAPYKTQLKTGASLTAKSVLNAQSRLNKHLLNTECFYNLAVRHEIVLNHKARNAHLRLLVNGENGAKFGETTFTGEHDIKPKYLSRFIEYQKGQCWDPRTIERTKTELLETGLLSAVTLNIPPTLPESKIVPINLEVTERAPRKVRLGAHYSTYEGPGVSAQWQHKNFLGSGEKLSVTTKLSALLQSLGTEFNKPFFISKKNTLNASATIEREDTDAFEKTALNVGTSINRKISDTWNGDLGVALETSKIIEDGGEEETFGLISTPAKLKFDNRDDPLDPHKGYTLALGAEPFFDAFGNADPFFKNRATATTYFDFNRAKYDPVLALRASVGSITGSDTDNIPATKRFYAGGGGSIRGFSFQEAGPQDEDGDPLGGRSLLETNAELRLKLTDKIGGVAFVDAGGAYDTILPDFDNGIYVGAGVGARYYTSFGPVRFDVATPITQRENAEQTFQIYISIGQSF